MITLRRLGGDVRDRCAVIVTRGRYGVHCGLLFAADDDEPRVLHLRWHLQLAVEPPGEGWWLVPSRLNRAQKAAVLVRAGQLAGAHQDGAVPYGFSLDGVSIDSVGRIDLAGQVGLTCASLLHLLHASVGAPLVALASWSERDERRVREDEAVEARMVRDLASEGYAAHARRLEREIGATRLRSEELAAASGMPHRPAELRDVAPEAEGIADQLRTRGP